MTENNGLSIDKESHPGRVQVAHLATQEAEIWRIVV
jgi:hypothetical protein